MVTDFLLVLGAALCVLAVPNAVSAYSEARAPRFATGMVIVGGSMFVAALVLHPEGYAIADIPAALLRVMAQIRLFFEN
ncbi:hypothetical protein [Celeribacter persicus]|jgi:hypothetical protein|uniref:50S ribosomal protein L35 n=1 Tax=Celeribacter persicus TaxID=1651082 RepID=A0A2T5HPD2_9RHOB|nr:hypothetical protein [Celeribacter persicus]PTQ73426.1 hypothetical protein C8N42_105127 [Celeribacter persicus]